MQLRTEDRDNTRIITIQEERIDAAIAIQFKESVRQAAGSESPRVLLDLSSVEFLDSSGLGAIVAAMKLLGPERRLELAALQPNVDRVFRLTRMDSVFSIYETQEEAFSSTPLADAG